MKSGTNSVSFGKQVCTMVGKEDRGKASALWNKDSEKFAIQQWHALSVQYEDKMILHHDKEKMLTEKLNEYMRKELGSTEEYTTKLIC